MVFFQYYNASREIVRLKVSRKIDLLLKLLVKKIEKMPRVRRQAFNSLVDTFQPRRILRERLTMRKLLSSGDKESFQIDRKNGFAKFDSDTEITKRMIEFANQTKRRHLSEGTQKGNSKDYLRQIWDLSKLDQDSQFMLEWALGASNLKAISKYFGGKIPLLHEISVFYSPETVLGEKSNWQGSQLFHMDGGGTQCVKLWLLCQDVKPDHGPTVVVSADQSARLAKKLNYKPGTRIQSDDDLSNLEELRTFALTGASGSWFATDTDRSFHYGSRTTEESSRLVIMFHYVDNNSSYYMPILSRHYRRQFKALPSIAREIAEKNPFSYEALKYRLPN